MWTWSSTWRMQSWRRQVRGVDRRAADAAGVTVPCEPNQRQAVLGYMRASCYLGLNVKGLIAWMDGWMEDVIVYGAQEMVRDTPWLHACLDSRRSWGTGSPSPRSVSSPACLARADYPPAVWPLTCPASQLWLHCRRCISVASCTATWGLAMCWWYRHVQMVLSNLPASC